MKNLKGWGIVLLTATVTAMSVGCAGDDEPGDGDDLSTAQVHKVLDTSVAGNEMSVHFTAADGTVSEGAALTSGGQSDVWEFEAKSAGTLSVVQLTRASPSAGRFTNEFRVAGVVPGERIEMEGHNPLPQGCTCVKGADPKDPGGVDLRIVTENRYNPFPNSTDNFFHVFVDDGVGPAPVSTGYDSRIVTLVSCAAAGYADLRVQGMTYECPDPTFAAR